MTVNICMSIVHKMDYKIYVCIYIYMNIWIEPYSYPKVVISNASHMNDMLKDKNVLYIMMICYCNKIITNAEMN